MHVHGIKVRNKRNHVKGKQAIKQKNKDSKTYKEVKTEAYDVKEITRQKQKIQFRVFGHKYTCAYIGLRTQASCMCTQA